MSAENKVRLIIKRTHQPPIDTPATFSWETLDIESDKLHGLLTPGFETYASFEVVGAEALQESSQ